LNLERILPFNVNNDATIESARVQDQPAHAARFSRAKQSVCELFAGAFSQCLARGGGVVSSLKI
jgi:hypothetical protein